MSIATSSSAANAAITAQIVNPIISSTLDTFEMYLDCTPTRNQLRLKGEKESFYPISSVIGLSGTTSGAICVSLAEETAFNAVQRMLDMEVTEVTSLVCDTVGEFSNVIAGSAKDKLAEMQLEIGLPSVITGKDHRIEFPTNAQPMIVTFDSEIGPFLIAFGFVARS